MGENLTVKRNDNEMLLGISCIIVGLGYLGKNFNIAYSDIAIIIGFYFFYKSLTGMSPIRHPNLYKIVITLIVMVFFTICVSTASSAYVTYGIWGGFGQNFGENISLLVDAIIKILNYFKTVNVN